MIVIRPTAEHELFERVRSISDDSNLQHSDLRQALAKLFNIIVHISVMKRIVKGKENEFLTGGLKTIYTFLAQNDLIEGSVIKRSLDFLSNLTEDYKKLNRVFTLLRKVKPPTFTKACEALFQEIKRTHIKAFVFFDDIDGFEFEYNQRNKAFLDALIINTMNVNTSCATNGFKLRTIVTPPTELFDNAKFWNKDKISSKTIFIRWNIVQKLQNLVNKRIAAELKVKKRKQRYPGDVYSIEPSQTWERIFPPLTLNRIGSKEKTINYIVRHTLYTPRSILSNCQTILQKLSDLGYSFETLATVREIEWNKSIQDACEENSNDIAKNTVDIYETIYPGIETLLELFEARPNIWTSGSLREFINNKAGNIVRFGETSGLIQGKHLIEILYSMGFLGYAFLSPLASSHLTRIYDVVFSYLKYSKQSSWDLAILSPVFYDYLRIKPIEKIIVAPHEQLKINWKVADQLAKYDYSTNTF